MARPVTTLVVFFLAFNLFAGMLSATGVAATIGIDSTVGEDEEFDQTVSDAGSVNSGTPRGDNLFGMYNVLSSQIGDFFDTIFPGLRMLNRAGVPGYITTGFLSPIFSIMIMIGVVSFLRGWNL